MNHILLTALASVALSFAVTSDAFGEALPQHDHAHHDHKMDTGKTADEMVKGCEGHLGTIKDTGTALPADEKAEFDYHLKIAGIEVEALKDPNHKDLKKHAHSCQHHLGNAERIVKKHENHMLHEKKIEERNAKVQERKAKAAARKAEREAAKAKRKAEKAERAAAHHAKGHGKEIGLDHGVSDGASKEAPGADAEKPLTEGKK